MDKHYTVRQTADMAGVKPYVLRYWEDELALHIERNELGHRYYTGYDIQLFLNIKELKSRGLQLRAIKDLIPQLTLTIAETYKNKQLLLENGNGQDGDRQSTDRELHTSAREKPLWPYPNLNEEKVLEFQQILERLIAQELMMKNEEEERWRSLDSAIRRQQMARREAAAAAASEKKSHKKQKKYRVYK